MTESRKPLICHVPSGLVPIGRLLPELTGEAQFGKAHQAQAFAKAYLGELAHWTTARHMPEDRLILRGWARTLRGTWLLGFSRITGVESALRERQAFTSAEPVAAPSALRLLLVSTDGALVVQRHGERHAPGAQRHLKLNDLRVDPSFRSAAGELYELLTGEVLQGAPARVLRCVALTDWPRSRRAELIFVCDLREVRTHSPLDAQELTRRFVARALGTFETRPLPTLTEHSDWCSVPELGELVAQHFAGRPYRGQKPTAALWPLE